VLEEQGHDCQLYEDAGVFQSPDLGFVQDAEIFLSGGVGSFGSTAEGFKLLMSISSAQNFVDQPGDILAGHVAGVAMIVDSVLALLSVPDDLRVF